VPTCTPSIGPPVNALSNATPAAGRANR
jgi:hypothetical protein